MIQNLYPTEIEAIMNACYDGIYVADQNLVSIWANKAFENITGMPLDLLIGKSLFDMHAEKYISEVISLRVLEQRQPVTRLQTYKNGKTALVTGIPIIKDNKVEKIVGTVRDMTDIKKLTDELKRNQALTIHYQRELEDLKIKDAIKSMVVFNSTKIKKLVELALRVSKVSSSVLILGESGVGKEVIAKLIHKSSPRRDQPFIEVNCGAIPKELIESELFGYESGAFTGAKREGKLGLFELANKGTIFLDEIGELPMEMQVKLLRVIQDLKVTKVGGTKPIPLDIKIIAATNRNLEEMVDNKEFREDLFYRINIVTIEIPPLRERKEDISVLSKHFLKLFNDQYNKDKYFHYKLIETFENYEWPGNVRELRNIIERLVVLTEEQCINSEHLPTKYTQRKELIKDRNLDRPLKDILEELEKEVIKTALIKYKTAVNAAKSLGLSQPTMTRKMQKYKLKEEISYNSNFE